MHIPKLMAKLHFVTEQNKKPFSHVQRLQIGIQFDKKASDGYITNDKC
ncbi:hypothetical protein JI435_411430 [Parastagonospora nodorum SN15]|uniref:Uncharacterized protein n=1 Tax=Phaeosphaeria nodorum (strain SN15 / ATCC MYA-4574 / FGSC 10173) TaxID=321614 RepID=A0A7U2F434_PHANO|nr:hypothetical protein JI435_411430 [Parastagonospora nodorum SN15]